MRKIYYLLTVYLLLALFGTPALHAQGLINGGFETGDLTGWTINNAFPGLPGDLPNVITQQATISSTEHTEGSYSLKLDISGNVTVGYATAHGPSATSNVIQGVAVGDIISVDWKALRTSDNYDVYAYIINATTGAETQLLYERGVSKAWTTTKLASPYSGDIQFKFVCGTQDASGGRAVGSTMYIDNIRFFGIQNATAATGLGGTGFTANWEARQFASTYYLDVATDSTFTNFLPGYNNLDVGTVTSYAISGLTPSGTYYYRVRSMTPIGLSQNSNVIKVKYSILNYSADANGTVSGLLSQLWPDGTAGSQVTAIPNQGYHFVRWSDGVTTATRSDASTTTASASFALNQLVFHTQPVTTAAGDALNYTVQIEDGNGNVITNDDQTIDIEFSNNAGNTTLLGTTTVTTVQGVANFTTTNIHKTSSGYTLLAKSLPLVAVTSSAFDITPGPLSYFKLTGVTPVHDLGISQGATVTAYDKFDNLKTDYTGTVHFSSDDLSAAFATDYSFTATDNGSYTFGNAVSFGTEGSWKLNVADASDASKMGTQSNITVQRVVNVTANNRSFTYGDPFVAGSSAFTVTDSISGSALPGNYGVSTVTLTSAATAQSAVAGSPYSIQASDASGSFNPAWVRFVYTDGAVTVLPRQLEYARHLISSKEYDGTTTALYGDTATIVNKVSGDDVNIVAAANYANSNSGNYKQIQVAYSLTGAAAGNYVQPADYSLTTGQIVPRQLLIAAPAFSGTKVYDGTTAADLTAGALTNLISGDDVTVASLANYNTANAGTDKVVGVSYTISGSSAANYLAPVSSSLNAVITPKPLVITVPTVAASKVYDGNTLANVAAGSLTNVIGTDVVNVTAVATYNNAHAGTAKPVTVSYSISGTDAGNYIAPAASSTTAAISAKQLTISDPAITLSKVYDGTTHVNIAAGALVNVVPVDFDSVNVVATAAYNTAAAGTAKSISVNYSLTGSAKDDYIAPVAANVSGAITAKQLTVSAPALTTTKTYDATTTAAVTAGTLADVVGNDAVSVSATANYNNANAATEKAIQVQYTLSGADAANYVAPVDYTVNNGIISAKQLTVSAPTVAISKVYDGTTVASVTAGTPNNVLGSDAVTVLATAHYNNAHVGTGKSVTVSYSIDGAAAGNYVAPVASTTTADITAKQLAISEPAVTLTKVYDGTTNAAVVAGALLNVLPVDFDNLNVVATAAYNTAAAGTAKSISVNYSLTGSAKDDYIAPVAANASGSITAKQLTISTPALTTTKTYDATTTAAVTAGTLADVVGSDAVSVSATANYNNVNAATEKAIQVQYTLSGADAANYVAPVDYTVNNGIISAKQLTVNAPTVAASKVYDGTTVASVTAGTPSNVLGSDAVTVLATAHYNNAHVGTGKSVTVSYSIDGAAAGNYVAPVASTSTANITAKQLAISEPAVTLTKVYDGTTNAAVVAGALLNVLPVDFDSLNVVATAAYNTAAAGTAKPISVNYSLTGSAKADYIAPISSTVSGAIAAKQLTIANTVVAASKVYDGSTTAVVTSAGTLGNVVAGDVVTPQATANYWTTRVGSQLAIQVNYTLSGASATNYLAPVAASTTGDITAKQLTISGTEVLYNKMYDGNTLATVTQQGTLNGVVSTDAGQVSSYAIANYDNVTVGTGKTISIVYALSGIAAANYFAPVTDAVSYAGIAKISDKVTLTTISTPEAGCEFSTIDLAYKLITGTPTQYRITYEDKALTAGFVNNPDYTDLPSGGIVPIQVADQTAFGTYWASLQLRNELNVESAPYYFQFTVNVSPDYIVQKFDDAVMVNNSKDLFAGYQWYKNGIAIEGATQQYYYDPSGLKGDYSVRLLTKDGQTVYSCAKSYSKANTVRSLQVSAYPNPVVNNSICTIRVSGVEEKELEGAVMQVYSAAGVLVYETQQVQLQNSLTLGTAGVYVGKIRTVAGQELTFKVVSVQ